MEPTTRCLIGVPKFRVGFFPLEPSLAHRYLFAVAVSLSVLITLRTKVNSVIFLQRFITLSHLHAVLRYGSCASCFTGTRLTSLIALLKLLLFTIYGGSGS
ncbi:hypothetical protein TRVL_09415 [Trypanosoma vivax]|uniref:Uncharacterized protein n=1 Tax=Trypanosoma vivax (strain Y486) TaxID=1055687 RepID=G0UCC6_TRYVY|nr:hypothetical protein TRVL_09415 [Trypanosoma vivax]CCC53477.1 hypothetical protein TVY486_1109610 [Trypanosoma vivax Y486]